MFLLLDLAAQAERYGSLLVAVGPDRGDARERTGVRFGDGQLNCECERFAGRDCQWHFAGRDARTIAGAADEPNRFCGPVFDRDGLFETVAGLGATEVYVGGC